MTEYPPSYCPDCGGPLDGSAAPRYRCCECDRHVYHSPVPAAGVVVIDGDAVLLVERGEPPNAGSWAIPAGHVDLAEAPPAAASRELREETAVEVPPGELTLVDAENPTPAGGSDRGGKAVIRVVYAVSRAETAEVPAAGDDATAVRWVDRAALGDVDWAFGEGPTAVRAALDAVGTDTS